MPERARGTSVFQPRYPWPKLVTELLGPSVLEKGAKIIHSTVEARKKGREILFGGKHPLTAG